MDQFACSCPQVHPGSATVHVLCRVLPTVIWAIIAWDSFIGSTSFDLRRAGEAGRRRNTIHKNITFKYLGTIFPAEGVTEGYCKDIVWLSWNKWRKMTSVIYTTIGGLSSKFDEFLAGRSQFDSDHRVDFYSPTWCLSATFVRLLFAFVLCFLR